MSLATLEAPIAPNKVLTDALAFPLDDVMERYANDRNIPLSIAKEHELELKKFLVLCILHPERRYGMSRIIDEFWHTFICFTRKYHRFCDQVAGRYIHHEPTTIEEKQNGAAIHGYMLTLADYAAYFTEEPPVHLWPKPVAEALGSSCQNGCGGNCDGNGCSQGG